VVSVEEGQELANEYGAQFVEVSPNSYTEIETVSYPCHFAQKWPITTFRFQGFTMLVREVKNRLRADGPQAPANGKRLNQPAQPKNQRCY
jgi:hypothetical protein